MKRMLVTVAAIAATAFLSFPAVGQVAPAPASAPGGTWTYRQISSYNHLPMGDVTRELVASPSGVQYVTRTSYDRTQFDSRYAQPGILASGPLNDRARGPLTPALELMPFPLEPGKTWKQTVVRKDEMSGQNRRVMVEGRVVGWETVKVPAGEFRAIKVERRLWLGDQDEFRGETWRGETEWYAPDVQGTVKLVVFEEYQETPYSTFKFMPGERYVYELTSFKRG